MKRKYNASVGVPEEFDFDGTLEDRRITPETAQRIVGALALLEPSLEYPIEITFSRRVYKRRKATVWPKVRRMNLYPEGQNEATLLHELAHIVANSDGIKHHHDHVFKAALLRLETMWYDIVTR